MEKMCVPLPALTPASSLPTHASNPAPDEAKHTEFRSSGAEKKQASAEDAVPVRDAPVASGGGQPFFASLFLMADKGTLALENALSSGSPIQSRVELLHTSVESLDEDSLSELAISLLREDVVDYGSDSWMESKQKALSEADEAEHKPLPKLLHDVSKEAEKYEKELKDTRTRELTYAKEAAILDKLMNGGGRFGGSKNCYCVAGGLHGFGLLLMKIAATMSIVLILAQPVDADRFGIFGGTSYSFLGYDVMEPYQTFHGGTIRSAILTEGSKFHGLDLLCFPADVKQSPRGWIAVEVNATGIDGDRVTLAIRDDNLFLIGFANKFDEWFCFSGQRAVLGCDEAHMLPFTNSYGPSGLMSPGLRNTNPKDLPEMRTRIDMRSLVLGQEAAIEAMLNLSRFNLAKSDLEHARIASRVFIVSICEAQRFKKVSGPILDKWPGPLTLPEVEFIWHWNEISCSMIVYNEKNGKWPADGVKMDKLKDAGADTYDKAAETVDVLQIPYKCLDENGILDKFRPPSLRPNPPPA